MAADSTVFLRRDPATKQWVTVPIADPAGDRLYVHDSSVAEPRIFQGIVPNGTNSVGYIDFKNGMVFDESTEGRLSWDDEAGTLRAGMKGGNVTMQIGQELPYRVRNTSGVLIGNGKAVRLTGWSGNRPTVALADNSSASTSDVFAVATEDIAIGQFGYVTVIGEVHDINTSSLTEAANVYLGTSGNLTSTPPASNVVVVGYCTYSHSSQGVLLVRISSMRDHNVLSGIQGGTTGQYYHMTSNQNTWLAQDLRTTASPTFTALNFGNYVQLTEDATSQGGVQLKFGSAVENGNYSVFVNGNTVLNDWFNQNVKTTASPTFNAITTAAPSGGSAHPWKFGGYTAGVATQVGKVRVEINGVAYDLLTA